MALRPPRRFWLPKAGNRPDEYEDAVSSWAYPQRFGAARIAVSDGASESAFAREWASALTEAFVTRPPELPALAEDSLNAWLAPPRDEWRSAVPWDRLPWHGEAKARAGAFATLLGLTVGAAPDDPRRLSWEAFAVGDSCLFLVRGGELCLSFPLDDAAQFDNNPALVCSNPANAGGLWDAVRFHEGECAPGDVFVLATDALACWFLAQAADGAKPWQTLMTVESSGWPDWIEEQRRAGSMRNDDTTLVVVEVA